MVGLWVTLKNSRFITGNNFLQQVRIGIKILENVFTHLHVPHLLVIIQEFWHKLCAFPDFLLLFAKRYFGLVQVYLISVEHLSNNFHKPFSLQPQHWFDFYWWKASTPWIILNILTSFFESFVSEKNC